MLRLKLTSLLSLALLAALAASSSAQVPQLLPVPEGLSAPQREPLVRRRSQLDARWSALRSKVDGHNRKCGSVRADTALAGECQRAMGRLQGEVSAYVSAVNAFNRTVRLASEERREAEKARRELQAFEKAARRKAIRQLRAQVRGLQEALRRMNPSVRAKGKRKEWTAQKELEAWKEVAAKTQASAFSRLQSLTIDLTLGMYAEGFAKRLKLLGGEIGRARKLLEAAKDPNRRQQLQAALRILTREETNLRVAKLLVADQMVKAKGLYNKVQAAKGAADDREKALRLVYLTLKTTLNDPMVKEAWEATLKYGKGLTATARFADSYVDSAYEITAGILSWRRIDQANLNMEQYLKAVEKIGERMEATLKKIKELEGER
ncbi:MAG: hypothetical protein ACE5IM_05225 [Nitrospinota bacterium]